jgi:phosphinothricin acetyltransferase
MKIKLAVPEDAAELLAIYENYIDTPITFEYERPTLSEFVRRIVDTLENYPYLVGIENDKIVGYAYAHRLQTRPAYQWSAELSIYLVPQSSGHGLGQELYSCLIELLKIQGVRTVYGCVTSPNPRSEAFHEKLGFRRIGRFHNAGYKNGVWHDISWFEKNIAQYDEPEPLIPFREIPGELVDARLQGR